VAAVHGNKSEVTIDGSDISEYLDSADLSIEQETVEYSGLGQGPKAKRQTVGNYGAKFELAGRYDAAAEGPSAALIAMIGSTTPAAIEYYPAGSATGAEKRAFNALLASYSESSPVGGIVAFKASLVVDGAITNSTAA
jgi:hypothetical protein